MKFKAVIGLHVGSTIKGGKLSVKQVKSARSIIYVKRAGQVLVQLTPMS